MAQVAPPTLGHWHLSRRPLCRPGRRSPVAASGKVEVRACSVHGSWVAGHPKRHMDAPNLTDAYQAHVGLLRARARRILGSTAAAEDVTQESFVRLLEYRREGGQDRETAAFLYRTVTNLALNRLRDSARRRELVAAHAAALDDGAGGLSAEDLLTLRRLLATSDPEEASIALHYYFDGMEQEEIAALVGLERRTVSRRLESWRRWALERLHVSSATGGEHHA